MSDLIVRGGRPLSGTVTPSGNKNAALPMLCASLLTDEPVVLRNVPAITDVEKLTRYFQSLGSSVGWDRAEGVVRLDHSGIDSSRVAPALPAGMRSALLLLPPLLHRFGRVDVLSNVQGCSLGAREIDPHIEVLEALGAECARDPLSLRGRHRLRGARVWQDYMSVTTTENFAMAAALAEGGAEMINAASEPHVQDLCRMLTAMGAQIEGIGTSTLRIQGVNRLGGCDCSVSPDHHEITTFLALGAMTGGEVRVTESLPEHFDLIVRAFGKLGVKIQHDAQGVWVQGGQSLEVRKPFTQGLLTKIEGAPWPYFPVDLLPLMVALGVRSSGQPVLFWNKVYEGAFGWVPELTKFGAHVVTNDPHRIIVFGSPDLRPAEVKSPYIIRAAVALYMVAASIDGESVIREADPIRRAHHNFVENLSKLGADVQWDD